jgi:hypothetical protein
MNQIVISKTFHHHGKTSESSVIVIESEQSVLEFDNLFRNALFTFITRWRDLDIQVQHDLNDYKKLEEGMKGYDEALRAFTYSFDEQNNFETNHTVFVHGVFKISLSSFIQAGEICDFSVLSLTDWLSIKTAESSVGFNS